MIAHIYMNVSNCWKTLKSHLCSKNGNTSAVRIICTENHRTQHTVKFIHTTLQYIWQTYEFSLTKQKITYDIMDSTFQGQAIWKDTQAIKKSLFYVNWWGRLWAKSKTVFPAEPSRIRTVMIRANTFLTMTKTLWTLIIIITSGESSWKSIIGPLQKSHLPNIQILIQELPAGQGKT